MRRLDDGDATYRRMLTLLLACSGFDGERDKGVLSNIYGAPMGGVRGVIGASAGERC